MAAYKEGAGDKESPEEIPQQTKAVPHPVIESTVSADNNTAKENQMTKRKRRRGLNLTWSYSNNQRSGKSILKFLWIFFGERCE